MDRVRRMDLVDDRLDVALDDRQRRAQLVGDVREQARSLSLAALEVRAHLVERAAKRSQLSWPADRHAHGVVARLEPLPGVDEITARRDQAPDRAGDGERD